MRLLVVLMAWSLGFTAAGARADEPAAPEAVASDGDRDLAQKRFATGKLLFARERYADALTEFQAAKAVLQLPAFDYNIGLCLAKLDRPADAADALERYIKSRPDDTEAAGIWQMIAELRAEAVRKREAATHDGAASPAVGASAATGAAAAATPTVAPPSSLVSKPLPSPRVRALRRAAIGSGVTTGALLIAWAATGGAALAQRGDYDAGCNRGACDQSRYDSGHRLAVASDVILAVTLVAAVATVVLATVKPAERRLAILGGHF